MKMKSLLMSALALAITLGAVQAQTEIRITGATAFRTATLNALLNRFQAGGDFRYAHDGSSFTGSTYAVFEGTYPGVSGTTTVRTSFNGSVEGLDALVNSPTADPGYLPSSVLPVGTSATGVVAPNVSTAGLVNQPSHLAFSDVSKDSTPFGSAALEPSVPAVGVVVFTMLANDGAPANLTNVTNKQFEALFKNGFEELSLFTGDSADNNKLVFACGRNDGSGTRTTYLAETGTGITTLVNQYVGAAAGGEITYIKLTGPTNEPSTIWSQNTAGNGGYSSGSALRSLFQNKSSAVDIYLGDTAVVGVDSPDLTDAITLITFLSNGDAVTAITGGAKPLAFNGVSITPANPLGATDVNKVAYGAYTAWGYENLYRISGLSTEQLAIDSDIRSNIGGLLGSAGIPIGTMRCSRAVDGGVVNSL